MGVSSVKEQVPTIDVALVTIEFTQDGKKKEIGFDTASKVAVEVQTETQDAVQLIIKNKLRAQKGEKTTITGNKITLTDNVFIPELVLLLQGGTIHYGSKHTYTVSSTLAAGSYYFESTIGNVIFDLDLELESGKVITFDEYTGVFEVDGTEHDYEIGNVIADEVKIETNKETTKDIVGYEPPVAGSGDTGESFVLNCYSSQYDEAGSIVRYEKISYPNCTGTPVNMDSEDGAFRAPEYTINSAPSKGQAPYKIVYVKNLPTVK